MNKKVNKKVNKKLSAILLAFIMIAVFAVASPAGKAQAAFSYYYNFQQTTKPFAAQATGGAATKLSRVFGGCSCDPSLINYYARLVSIPVNNTVPGAGQATWMMVALPAAQGEADSVTISFTARTEAATSGAGLSKHLAIAYAGAMPPKGAKDFSVIPQATAMNSKWANYRFSTVIASSLSPNTYVALGWNGIGSAIDVDCVRITIVPIVK